MKTTISILLTLVLITSGLLFGQESVEEKSKKLEETVDEKMKKPDDKDKKDRSDDWQQNTLFDDKEVSHGGFGGPAIKLSAIKNRGHLFVGGRGGWIINHFISLGGAGYGLVDATELTGMINGTNRRYHMGYGGFEIGLTFMSDSLIHLNMLTLIGAGGLGYSTKKLVREHVHDDPTHQDYNRDFEWNEESRFHGDAFFVVEPMLFLELNVTKWMRLCLGGGYRYVDGLKGVPNYSNKDLSGPSAEIVFKFGKF